MQRDYILFLTKMIDSCPRDVVFLELSFFYSVVITVRLSSSC